LFGAGFGRVALARSFGGLAALWGVALALALALALGASLGFAARTERLAAFGATLAALRLLLAGVLDARRTAFLTGFFDFWGIAGLPNEVKTTNTVRDRNTVHKCLALAPTGYQHSGLGLGHGRTG